MPPGRPQEPPRKGETIEAQISGAIAKGFETVLTDIRAQNAEMISALKEISRRGQVSSSTSVSAPSVRRSGPAVNVAVDASERAESLSKRLDTPHNVHNASVKESAPETRKNLRESLADSFSRHAEAWVPGVLGQAEDGSSYTGVTRRLRHGVHMGANGRYYEKGKKGSIRAEDAFETLKLREGYGLDENGVMRNAHGRFGHIEHATEAEEAGLLRRGIMANRAIDVAQAWKNGEPIGRALMHAAPPGLLKAAGYGAMAIQVAQAADKGWQKIQNQYAENRKYQEYYGGSNMDQVGERANRWFNKNIRGRFSLLGGDAYDELFGQAMDMGLRGSHRDDYIKYGSQIMGQGADAGQARELMSITLESGGTARSLRELVGALKDVSNVAREAQVSSKEAREIFIQNYKAATSMMFGPSGSAIDQAQAYTQSAVGMGHAYMNSVDYTGMNDKKFAYANAATMGIAPSQYYVMQEQYSSLPGMSANEDRVREVLNQLQSETGGNRTVEQVVADFQKKLGRPLDESDYYDLGVELESAGFNRDTVFSVLSTFGIKVDSPAAAMGVAGNLFTANAPSQTAARLQGSTVDRLTAAPDLGRVKIGSSVPSNTNAYSDLFDVQPGWNNALRDIYTKTGAGNRVVSRLPGTVELELLRNVGSYGLDPDTKVLVRAGNEDRVVTLQDALKYFPDQISNGSAKIMEGDQEGKTIADIMKFTGTSVAQQPTTSGSTHAGIGEALADYRSEEQSKDSGEKGSESKVMIDLKPRVAEIFDIYLNGKYYQPGVTG